MNFPYHGVLIYWWNFNSPGGPCFTRSHAEKKWVDLLLPQPPICRHSLGLGAARPSFSYAIVRRNESRIGWWDTRTEGEHQYYQVRSGFMIFLKSSLEKYCQIVDWMWGRWKLEERSLTGRRGWSGTNIGASTISLRLKQKNRWNIIKWSCNMFATSEYHYQCEHSVFHISNVKLKCASVIVFVPLEMHATFFVGGSHASRMWLAWQWVRYLYQSWSLISISFLADIVVVVVGNGDDWRRRTACAVTKTNCRYTV